MAQTAKAVTVATPPPVKLAVTTATACQALPDGIEDRRVILVAFAPDVGVTETPPPSGTFGVGHVAEAVTVVPLGGFATVVVVGPWTT